MLGNQVYDCSKKHSDREFIDAMHHSNVEIVGTIGIMFPKEISANFSQGEELSKSAFGDYFFLFHKI